MATDPFLSAGTAKNAAGAAYTSDSGVVDSYSWSKVASTPAATPTDVVTITGSATRKVVVRKVIVSGIATTAGQMTCSLVRRSTANTGGTSTAPAARSRELSQPAATAVLALYTVNPTAVGAGIGVSMESRVFLNLATAQPDRLVFDFMADGMKPIVLSGVTDILAINFNGGAVPAGGSLDFQIEWTEE